MNEKEVCEFINNNASGLRLELNIDYFHDNPCALKNIF